MNQATNQSSNADDLANFIRSKARPNRQKRDFTLLDPDTAAYLKVDKETLQALAKQTYPPDKSAKAAGWHVRSYYFVEDFFFYQVTTGQSTRLADITTPMIEAFLNRPRPIYQYKPTKQASIPGENQRVAQVREKLELKAFFERAEIYGFIRDNPVLPLYKSFRLAPLKPSAQTQDDSQAFEKYLQRLIGHNRLSPRTADRYRRNFRILLHDMEKYHADDPHWPTELNDFFADPKWAAQWLNNLANRSPRAKSPEVARQTIHIYLLTVRHVWLFLKAQGRADPNYYQDLKALFRLDGSSLLLPGRSPQIIDALSEAEQEAVFIALQRYSTGLILRLRDTALFITAIETTMRMDSLNSMKLENFKELENGVTVCRVKAKRSSRKNSHSLDRLSEDQAEWRDWYISPHALTMIGEYLQATKRNWQSQGAVWLTEQGEPLSLGQQGQTITQWLKIAGCHLTRPHVLRHTGIDQLINKFNQSIPTVQAISQHADPKILLKVYARRAQADAFRAVSQVFPADPPDAMSCQELISSIGVKLNELSAGISRRKQDQRVFTAQHAEELLEALRSEVSRLVTFLGFTTNEVVGLSSADYQRLGAALLAAGLSYQQVLGYEPKLPTQTLIKRTGRKPKPLMRPESLK